jgi:hypothetical protein
MGGTGGHLGRRCAAGKRGGEGSCVIAEMREWVGNVEKQRKNGQKWVEMRKKWKMA